MYTYIIHTVYIRARKFVNYVNVFKWILIDIFFPHFPVSQVSWTRKLVAWKR